jgi:predicted CopG family antitoxin
MDSWTDVISKNRNRKQKNVTRKLKEWNNTNPEYNYNDLEISQLVERKNSLLELIEDISPNKDEYDELSNELEYIKLEIKRRYLNMTPFTHAVEQHVPSTTLLA